MSKLQLKKELLNMDRNQLIQLILDAYVARKETKEYLDFFLNPDVDRLLEKAKADITRELKRARRGGYCKARISYIKNRIKLFDSFQPGYEAQMELLLYAIRVAVSFESFLHFPDTLERGVASLVRQYVDLADRNLVADAGLRNLDSILNESSAGSRYFRKYLRDELASYLALSHPGS